MSDNNPAALLQIGQIAINVKDLVRATEFYREKLALKYLFTAGTMAFFDCGGIRLMLAKPEKPEFDHPSSIIYFKVRKTTDSHADLRARGVEFESEPRLIARLPHHNLWMAFFRDSENNLLAIMSEEPKAAQ